jgi:hypothetical protein
MIECVGSVSMCEIMKIPAERESRDDIPTRRDDESPSKSYFIMADLERSAR